MVVAQLAERTHLTLKVPCSNPANIVDEILYGYLVVVTNILFSYIFTLTIKLTFNA